jgi:hypothetical protein
MLFACLARADGSSAESSIDCRQLVEAPDLAAGDRRRFETLRVSLRLRAGAPWQRVGSPDSEAYVQHAPGLEVGIDSSTLRPFSAQDPARDGCVLLTEGGPLRVVLAVPKRNVVVATFLDPHDPELGHTIGVEATEPGRAWPELKSILRSLPFLNRFENIQVCAISALDGRFEYRNEMGDLRRGALGTTMTRRFGRVTRLEPDAVHLSELISDGAGGYEAMVRVLPRSDCD